MFYSHDFSFFGQKLNWLVQISDIQTFIQELLFTEKPATVAQHVANQGPTPRHN